jgi:hypothetical protein
MGTDSKLRKTITVGVLLTLVAGVIAGALQPLLMPAEPAPLAQVAYTAPVKPSSAAPAVALMPDALPSMSPQSQQRDLELQVESVAPHINKTPKCQAFLASAQEVLKGAGDPGAKQTQLNSLHRQALKERCL